MNSNVVEHTLGFPSEDMMAARTSAPRVHRLRWLLVMVACLVAILTAGAVWAAGKLGPGDSVGGMHVVALDTTKPWSVSHVSYMQRTYKIGDMPELLSDVWCSVPNGYFPSAKGGTYTMLCTGPMTQTLVIGLHWNASTTAELDTVWQSSSFELFVDGQQVDLSKFTTVDFRLPIGTLRRQYAIGLTKSQGVHKVRHVIHDRTDPTNPDSTYVFDITFLTPAPQTLPVTGMPPTDKQDLYISIGFGLLAVIACGWLLAARSLRADPGPLHRAEIRSRE